MRKLSLFLLSLFLISSFVIGQPSYDNFKDGISENQYDYNLQGDTLEENITSLFYPDSGGGGQIWGVIRVVGVGLFVLTLVGAGINFVVYNESEDEIKKARDNLLYIFAGGAIFFGATWILGEALNIRSLSGSEELTGNIQDNLLFQVLAFLKGGAFFASIVAIMYFGFKIIKAYESEDKINAGIKGIVNVLVALVLIKVIDFIYYIAQEDDFKSQAGEFIADLTTGLGYLLGIALLMAIFYSGFMLITSRGDEEAWNKTKNIMITVFIVIIIVFLFLLIIYQIINDLV